MTLSEWKRRLHLSMVSWVCLTRYLVSQKHLLSILRWCCQLNTAHTMWPFKTRPDLWVSPAHLCLRWSISFSHPISNKVHRLDSWSELVSAFTMLYAFRHVDIVVSQPFHLTGDPPFSLGQTHEQTTVDQKWILSVGESKTCQITSFDGV